MADTEMLLYMAIDSTSYVLLIGARRWITARKRPRFVRVRDFSERFIENVRDPIRAQVLD